MQPEQRQVIFPYHTGTSLQARPGIEKPVRRSAHRTGFYRCSGFLNYQEAFFTPGISPL
jgi:hypothetical protein